MGNRHVGSGFADQARGSHWPRTPPASCRITARLRGRSRRTAIRRTQAERVRVVAHWVKDTPLQLSNLRAPGKIPNVFAVEALTDALAAAAGVTRSSSG